MYRSLKDNLTQLNSSRSGFWNRKTRAPQVYPRFTVLSAACGPILAVVLEERYRSLGIAYRSRLQDRRTDRTLTGSATPSGRPASFLIDLEQTADRDGERSATSLS